MYQKFIPLYSVSIYNFNSLLFVDNKMRFALQRVGGHQKQIWNNNIQQNLPSDNTKLRRAQHSYYSGISPLSLNIKREPVHARLGVLDINNRQQTRVPFYGTNTSFILPKWKRNTANARMINLRKKLQQNRQQNSTTNFVNKQKFFKLRRNFPQNGDLTIQVPNNLTNHTLRPSCECGTRHQVQLDLRLQTQIKNVQRHRSGVRESPINVRVASFATSTTINERINTLS